jgi:hypothetical protein
MAWALTPDNTIPSGLFHDWRAEGLWSGSVDAQQVMRFCVISSASHFGQNLCSPAR